MDEELLILIFLGLLVIFSAYFLFAPSLSLDSSKQSSKNSSSSSSSQTTTPSSNSSSSFKFLSSLQSTPSSSKPLPKKKIVPKFSNLQEIQQKMKQNGLTDNAGLILAIDYTKSNLWGGKSTFLGKSLHTLETNQQNPYQKAISVLGKVFDIFDQTLGITVFGFGDLHTKNFSVFPMTGESQPCHSVKEILETYQKVTSLIQMSGPTNFQPIIDTAQQIVNQTQKFHFLLILTDEGQVKLDNKDILDFQNLNQIDKNRLQIGMVGIGDGPFDEMLSLPDSDVFSFTEMGSLDKLDETQLASSVFINLIK